MDDLNLCMPKAMQKDNKKKAKSEQPSKIVKGKIARWIDAYPKGKDACWPKGDRGCSEMLKEDAAISASHGGSPTSACPDGIGPNGVMMMNPNGALCFAWSSSLLHGGRKVTCSKFGKNDPKSPFYAKKEVKVCTVIAVQHPDRCEGNSAVLAFKRVVCTEADSKSDLYSRCHVFKASLCFHIPNEDLNGGPGGNVHKLLTSAEVCPFSHAKKCAKCI